MEGDLGKKPIRFIKGVGPQRAKLFSRLKINTVNDLLNHYPRKYIDRSKLKTIDQLSPNNLETIFAFISDVVELKPKKNIRITKVLLRDKTGLVSAVWFNQPYLQRQFKKGLPIFVSGKVERRFGELQFINPEFELFSGEDSLNINRIVPVYPSTEGLSQKVIRNVIASCLSEYLNKVDEIIPQKIIKQMRLMDKRTALKEIHFPSSEESLIMARNRLVFEELFLLQLIFVLQRKKQNLPSQGVCLKNDGQLVKDFLQLLPFELTGAQKKVWAEIKKDLEDRSAMQRLVQGDVGSGKTILAALALLHTVESGYQGALMAPTEILSEQHYNELKVYFEKLGVRVGLLTGSLSKKEKEMVLAKIANAQLDVVIGTHALIQEEVQFARLGLVITDEQHRFGVRQRTAFAEKGINPNILVMTATPIPRTLALTLYGDLDLSIVDELPPGRQKVQTYWLPSSEKARVFSFCESEMKKGRQIYFVCPLVEESDKLEAEAATKLVDDLRQNVFPHRKIGLLHGKMKTEEKDLAMRSFKNGETDILVATTVIEVGVNIPNATVMVIEDAERFGLAQLHQLRGRVGRGNHQSYCILISDVTSPEGQARLRTMCKTFDGFRLAEEDLKIRGFGELLGTRQHGLPDLKLTNLFSDGQILEAARRAAFALFDADPNLNKEEHKALKEKLSNYLRSTEVYTTA
ncbi:MAG TPA: ATP-dependent DNA helicase RecG [Clostridia bacterium]|nr:ATP-dependent DNA helicase RecG [Clostridia bacterium]